MPVATGSSNNSNSSPSIPATLPAGVQAHNISDVRVDNGQVTGYQIQNGQVVVNVSGGSGHSVATGSTPHSYTNSVNEGLSGTSNFCAGYTCPQQQMPDGSMCGGSCSESLSSDNTNYNITCSYSCTYYTTTYSTYYAYNVTVNYDEAQSRAYHTYQIGGHKRGIIT